METEMECGTSGGRHPSTDGAACGSSSDFYLESGRNFRALIEHANDGIALINAQGRMIFASPSARRMFGYPPDFPMESLDNDASTHPDDLPSVLGMLNKLMQHPGMVQTLEYRFRRCDGGWHWVESCFSNLLDVQGVEAVVINFRIIDERKRAEKALATANDELAELLRRAEKLAVEAEAATRAKSEFLAVMSHELRTPLNAVLGFAEVLADTPLDEEQRTFLDTIHRSGDQLLELVSDLLDYSSMESGGIVIEPSRILLAGLVESACLAIHKSAVDKGLDFRCEISPRLPDRITADERRVRKILAQLLDNAVKFTSKGSILLSVVESSEGGRTALEFSVNDTGPGIPAGMLGMVFQPFTQADSTMRRAHGGTGLGLASSRRLAEAMGGRLTVTSMPGKGSTFTLRLPIEGDPCAGSAQSAQSRFV